MIIQIVVQNAIRRSGLFKPTPSETPRRKDKTTFIMYLFAISFVITACIVLAF